MYTHLYTLAMIATLMPHLRIGPYKEGVLIAQIQMPFHAVGRSFPYELLILLIPTPLVSVFSAASLVIFFSFSFLFQYLFVIKFYVLNNRFAQYKHTYGQLRASHCSHMKAAHNVLYMKKHTQTYASYPAMDISCMTSRSVM